jgi:hypothetical protein
MSSQIDAIVKRLEYYWCEPGQGKFDVSISQMAAILVILAPREYRTHATAMAMMHQRMAEEVALRKSKRDPYSDADSVECDDPWIDEEE